MSQTLGSNFALKEMILQGWPILSVLLFCSVLSLAAIWNRWLAFRKANSELHVTAKHIAGKIGRASGVAEKERVGQNEILRWMAPLENNLVILGTVASTAPFIGLLGTVLGIIQAFRAISMSLGGGPSVVANGIAEALVTTAAGLIVAIPAVVAYNYFNRNLQALEGRLQLAVEDIVNGASRGE